MNETTRKVDSIDIPFVTDENLIGTWVYADFVKHSDDFMPEVQRWPGQSAFDRMIFYERGSIGAISDNGEFLRSALMWTNGFIISEPDRTCAAYEIREIDGNTYLFFEWKSGDYIYRMMEPWIYVFKKEEMA